MNTPKLHSSHFEVLKKNFQPDILKLLNTNVIVKHYNNNTKWNLANAMKQNLKKQTSCTKKEHSIIVQNIGHYKIIHRNCTPEG
jgi:hypothetical protein